MTAIADLLPALVAIAKADAATAALVGTRVYGMALPAADADDMPRKCIVLQPSGGVIPSWAGPHLRLDVERIDAHCYGENFYEARRVRNALHGAFREAGRQVKTGVLVHWIIPAGGLVTFIDPDTDWPRVVETWSAMAAEQAAS